MNCFNGIGRLTKDSTLAFTQGSGNAVAKFNIAIDRDFKNANGEKEADFLNCVMFGKSAEGLSQYLIKGKLIGITGRIQTGSYTNKENVKIYTTDIVVEKVKFLDSKKQADTSNDNDMTPVDDGDIPF